MNLIAVRELYRPKASGWVAHNGLELIFSDSSPLVFHNSPVAGPVISTYEQFAEQQGVTVKSQLDQNLQTILGRVHSLLSNPRKYHPTTFNCEQAVSLVVSGVAKSPQLKTTIGGGLFSGGVCLLLGGSVKQAIVATGIGSAVGLATSKYSLLSSEQQL